METLRKVKDYHLNKGDGMARGMFNITNEKIIKTKPEEAVSFWFDGETKDELMALSDEAFAVRAKKLTLAGIIK